MAEPDTVDWIFSKWVEESIKNPEKTPSHVQLLTLTPHTIIKIFTPSRAALLNEIAQGRCKSIQELSRKLKRPVPAVSRDLSVLEFHGLVKLSRNGKTKTPTLSKQLVVVPLASR